MGASSPSTPDVSRGGAQCLVLLADEGLDWPYAFVQMNNAMLHMLLSSEGHIESEPQRNPCDLLHQLQPWRLLQCGKWVVCPGGLNAGLDAFVFNFEELPLWNVVTAGEAARDPSMIEVELCGMKPKAISTTQYHPSSPPLNPSLILPKPSTSIFRGL